MMKVKPVKLGKTERMSFSHIDEVISMPNLIEVQKNSYQWFLDEGLKEVFHDIGTIEDYTGNLALSFVDFRLDKEPKYSIKECKERDVTYAAPLRVTARLLNKETGEVKDQEIFMGDFPLMTDAGTFVTTVQSAPSSASWSVLPAYSTVMPRIRWATTCTAPP